MQTNSRCQIVQGDTFLEGFPPSPIPSTPMLRPLESWSSVYHETLITNVEFELFWYDAVKRYVAPSLLIVVAIPWRWSKFIVPWPRRRNPLRRIIEKTVAGFREQSVSAMQAYCWMAAKSLMRTEGACLLERREGVAGQRARNSF